VNDQGESFSPSPRTWSSGERGERSEGAGPWLWANQMREVLGEDGELDPRILEESWASGIPVGLEAFRARREQVAAGDVGGGTFSELNSVGSFWFSQATVWVGDRGTSGHSAHTSDSYTASWLRDPMEGDQASESAEGGGRDAVGRRPGTMTRERACELLGVGEDSCEMQIKVAYRRRVSEWHPDRMEQRDERVRSFATEQMVAINEAYHLLRGREVAMAR
jgi:hypothetical protein